MMEKRRVAFAAFRHRKAGKKSFSGFYSEKRERISEARKLAHPFFLYFWGQKYQKPPHVVLRGSVRAAALHGARKIWPMRHPVADAPQPAPSFSASNESADWWCRQRRHCLFYMAMRLGSPFQLPAYFSCPPPAACHFCFAKPTTLATPFFFFRKVIPDLVPMAKERTEG